MNEHFKSLFRRIEMKQQTKPADRLQEQQQNILAGRLAGWRAGWLAIWTVGVLIGLQQQSAAIGKDNNTEGPMQKVSETEANRQCGGGSLHPPLCRLVAFVVVLPVSQLFYWPPAVVPMSFQALVMVFLISIDDCHQGQHSGREAFLGRRSTKMNASQP